MNKCVIVIVCLIVSAVVAGCGGAADSFGRFVDLPRSGWAYGDTVRIVVADIDSISGKRLSVAIRHNDDFLYRNLWIEVSCCDTAGTALCDTVNMTLADDYGRWLGKGIGASYQCVSRIDRNFNVSGGAIVNLRHVMRVDTVRGVEQIGIIIEPEKP